MARGSGIEWTEATWNPVTGCTKISPGCKHCYAERMARRLQAMGRRTTPTASRLTLHEHCCRCRCTWRARSSIFVNSMSDLFHEAVAEGFIQRAFEVMEQAHWHRFQVLTKRSRAAARAGRAAAWPANVWMGVSVETSAYLDRMDDLRATRRA